MPLPDTLTFRGRPLLLMMPHAVDSRPLGLRARGEVSDVITGARTIETNPATPGGVHQLDFVPETRTDIRLLEDFFDARQGAFEGFWVPTWQWEFEMAPYDGGSDMSHDYFWIRQCGYSAGLFPLGDPYRWLMFLYRDRYWIRYVVDATDDNPVGSRYERLNLSDQAASVNYFDGLPKPWTEAKGVRPLWLRYVRFTDDDLETEELGLESARITFKVVERPGETP